MEAVGNSLVAQSLPTSGPVGISGCTHCRGACRLRPLIWQVPKAAGTWGTILSLGCSYSLEQGSQMSLNPRSTP